MGSYPATALRLAGIWLPRPVVARRIEERFGAMVRPVWSTRCGPWRPVPRAGPARPARPSATGRCWPTSRTGVPLEGALAEAVRRTRGFARRQRMWWRRDPRITWFGADENPLAVLPALLGDWRQP